MFQQLRMLICFVCKLPWQQFPIHLIKRINFSISIPPKLLWPAPFGRQRSFHRQVGGLRESLKEHSAPFNKCMWLFFFGIWPMISALKGRRLGHYELEWGIEVEQVAGAIAYVGWSGGSGKSPSIFLTAALFVPITPFICKLCIHCASTQLLITWACNLHNSLTTLLHLSFNCICWKFILAPWRLFYLD